MKRSCSVFFLVFIAFFLIFISVPAWSSDEYRIVKKAECAVSEIIDASLIAYRGEVSIAGQVNGSILQIGGKLTVSGTVKEDIIALGTDVELLENARVEGDFLLLGGTLSRAESVVIKGEYFFVKLGSKEIDTTAFPLLWGGKTLALIKVIKIILWMLLGLMVYAIFPQRIHAVSLLLKKESLGRILLLGLLTVSIVFFLLLVFTLLSLIVIGIPLLISLLMLGAVLLVVSRTVMLYVFGAMISRLLNRTNPILFIILGAGVYGAIKFIPFLGTPLVVGIDLIGCGMVVSYLLLQKKSRQSR